MRVEADWVGDRHVVSASLVTDQPSGEVAEAAAGTRPLRKLFRSAQEQFIRQYASQAVDLDKLRVLGPITATKWEQKEVDLPEELAAERWEVDDLQFLEMSIRVDDPLQAHSAQRGLEQLMRDHGLLADVVQETKTRTVLEYLSRRS